MKTDKSQELFNKACQVLPGGVNSPVRAFKAVGGVPRFIERGEGAYLFDVDGNRYLDFCNSWGPLILGHAHPKVVAAITDQVSKGASFGATTELEFRLAEFIVKAVPGVESIRFVSSGTEAVMSAIRVARGFTGRNLILKFDGCYHGHADHLLVKAGSGLATLGQPSSAGVPESFSKHTAVLPLDDEDALRAFFEQNGDRLAAAIIEGVPANNGLLVQRPGLMRLLRSLTEKHGALLILDEVITGFRLGLQGAAGLYELKPDLLTYGKVIGGGLPVGAFGGRGDVMKVLAPEGPVYQAGTLSGNPLAMAAGLATLEQVATDGFYDDMERKTVAFEERLAKGMQGTPFCTVHIGSIVWLAFQEDIPLATHQILADGIKKYNGAHRDVLDAGIYLPPSGYEVCFISAAHTDDMLDAAAGDLVRLFGGKS